MRPERTADHSSPSSAAFMEEWSYTSTHPLGHTGPLMGSLLLRRVKYLRRNEAFERESEIYTSLKIE